MRISSLHTYPVKSLAGIDMTEISIETAGLQYDRNWMVVDAAGQFVSQRHLPRMALIKTRLTESDLILSTPNGDECSLPLANRKEDSRDVKVWGDSCLASDVGDHASNFLGTFLGPYRDGPLRLVRMQEDFIRKVPKKNETWPTANTQFADAYPLLIISKESLADLNGRLQKRGEDALPMNRFRPNIVIEGLGAYSEDRNPLLRLTNGIEIQLVSPCVRCKMTTINQDSAEIRPEPLRIFSEYRRNPDGKGVVFGQNAILKSGSGQKIRVGMGFSLEPRHASFES